MCPTDAAARGKIRTPTDVQGRASCSPGPATSLGLNVQRHQRPFWVEDQELNSFPVSWTERGASLLLAGMEGSIAQLLEPDENLPSTTLLRVAGFRVCLGLGA